jgi:GNAT superfamily N-acetyltransferase
VVFYQADTLADLAEIEDWLPFQLLPVMRRLEPHARLLGAEQGHSLGADTVYGPMLGPAAATISCVGVAPHMEGRGIGTALVARASEILRDRGAGACHISWTVREYFYARAGYRPWRRYRMFRTPTSPR